MYDLNDDNKNYECYTRVITSQYIFMEIYVIIGWWFNNLMTNDVDITFNKDVLIRRVKYMFHNNFKTETEEKQWAFDMN